MEKELIINGQLYRLVEESEKIVNCGDICYKKGDIIYVYNHRDGKKVIMLREDVVIPKNQVFITITPMFCLYNDIFNSNPDAITLETRDINMAPADMNLKLINSIIKYSDEIYKKFNFEYFRMENKDYEKGTILRHRDGTAPFVFREYDKDGLPIAIVGIDSGDEVIINSDNDNEFWCGCDVVPLNDEEKQEFKEKLNNKLSKVYRKFNFEKLAFEEIKYVPKDKEPVWAWDNWVGVGCCMRHVGFYDAVNKCVFDNKGKRGGFSYDNYAQFELPLPNWVRSAFNELED